MIFTDKVLEFSENISFRFSDKEQTFECGFPIKAVIWTEEGTSDESSIGSCVFSSFLLYVYLGASITWAKSPHSSGKHCGIIGMAPVDSPFKS